jgi:cytochrome c
MKLALTTAATLLLAVPAFAADIAAGEKDYAKCKACHMIVADDGTEIVKGGKVGPNLYGVIGRVAGSVEGFKYGADTKALGETGYIWTEADLAVYVGDPKGFVGEKLGKAAKSSMAAQKLKAPENVAAYLASLKPAS